MKPNRIPWRLKLIAFVALGMSVLLINPERAQAQIYQYHSYWGMNAWVTESYLPPTTLQITQSGETVSIWWPLALSNALLQTTTEISPASGWSTVTNPPVPSAPLDSQTVILPATNAQQFFRLSGTETALIPIFSFAVFVDRQMELTWAPPLVFRGRVHANGPICLGPPSTSSLRFDNIVTTASSIVYSNLGGYSITNMTGLVTYNGTPPYRTNTPPLLLSGVTTNARAIIEFPPLGESPNSAVGLARFYNKASIALLVSNTSVTMIVKDYGALTGTTTNVAYNSASPSATERTNLAQALPFLRLTNVFRDYRENDWVMPTQIDMGVLKNWLPTNSTVLARYPAGSGIYPNILYVGDFRTLTNLHAVRLTNGVVIPTNGPSAAQATGFTIATPNPLYVWGHYNTPNAAHQGTTNTSATFPASLVCDAITVLSPSWADNDSSNLSDSSRDAANTTVNSAIIAGSVYSTGSAVGQWSGGIHNLPRLMEDWGGRTLTLNTSLVNLYNSVHANTQFQNPGIYYLAPTRNFNFNQNFLLVAKLPPGTPVVVGIVPAD